MQVVPPSLPDAAVDALWMAKPVVGAGPLPSRSSVFVDHEQAARGNPLEADSLGVDQEPAAGELTVKRLQTPSCMPRRAIQRRAAARSTRACCVAA